jgi:hypothetical protein
MQVILKTNQTSIFNGIAESLSKQSPVENSSQSKLLSKLDIEGTQKKDE